MALPTYSSNDHEIGSQTLMLSDSTSDQNQQEIVVKMETQETDELIHVDVNNFLNVEVKAEPQEEEITDQPSDYIDEKNLIFIKTENFDGISEAPSCDKRDKLQQTFLNKKSSSVINIYEKVYGRKPKPNERMEWKTKIMKCGDTFESFDEFKTHLEKFEKEQGANYYNKESRTFKKAPRRLFNPSPKKSLIYYDVKFVCVEKEKKEKTNQTSQSECKSFVFLRLTQDRQLLKIIRMNTKHNHPVNKKTIDPFFLEKRQRVRDEALGPSRKNNNNPFEQQSLDICDKASVISKDPKAQPHTTLNSVGDEIEQVVVKVEPQAINQIEMEDLEIPIQDRLMHSIFEPSQEQLPNSDGHQELLVPLLCLVGNPKPEIVQQVSTKRFERLILPKPNSTGTPVIPGNSLIPGILITPESVLSFQEKNKPIQTPSFKLFSQLNKQMANNSEILHIGDEFDSFEEFQYFLQEFEKEQCINYYKRDSRTLGNAAKRYCMLNPKPDLIYYEVRFLCRKGGQKYKSRSTGIRPNQKSCKDECRSFVSLRLSRDEQKLIVTNMSTMHNHILCEETFKNLPKQRRLDIEDINEIKPILSSNPNSKILRDLKEKIQKRTGKMVTLRDLQYQSYLLKKKESHG